MYVAWGNCTIENDVSGVRIGEVNSFRYRGYYYDSDLGLYYLKSRYYDAVTGRFINADSLNYLGANGDLCAYNLFAYCSCNPVMRVDRNGCWWWLVAAVVAAAACLSGCETTSTKSAAPKYKKIGSSNGDRKQNANCYEYAIGIYNCSYDPGGFSSPLLPNNPEVTELDDYLTIDNVVNAVLADFEQLGRGIRTIDSYDSPIESNEYRIALKVTEGLPVAWYNGEWIFVWYYHFMVQTSEGGWAEKNGANGSTQYYDIDNPSNASWMNGRYDSDIIYFAITN